MRIDEFIFLNLRCKVWAIWQFFGFYKFLSHASLLLKFESVSIWVLKFWLLSIWLPFHWLLWRCLSILFTSFHLLIVTPSLRVSSHLINNWTWISLECLLFLVVLTNEVDELLTKIDWLLLRFFPHWFVVGLNELRCSHRVINNIIGRLVELARVLSSRRSFLWRSGCLLFSNFLRLDVLRTNELERIKVIPWHPCCKWHSTHFLFWRFFNREYSRLFLRWSFIRNWLPMHVD